MTTRLLDPAAFDALAEALATGDRTRAQAVLDALPDLNGTAPGAELARDAARYEDAAAGRTLTDAELHDLAHDLGDLLQGARRRLRLACRLLAVLDHGPHQAKAARDALKRQPRFVADQAAELHRKAEPLIDALRGGTPTERPTG